MIAEHGYTIVWLWHSKVEGPEGIPNSEGIPVSETISSTGYLSPTFAIVIHLARIFCNIYLNRNYYFFLDNLFLNVNVALALLELGILYIGTTRKNAVGVPY